MGENNYYIGYKYHNHETIIDGPYSREKVIEERNLIKLDAQLKYSAPFIAENKDEAKERLKLFMP